MDRNYTSLLTHLHRPNSTLPLETVQGALSHYLAHLSPPTPLAAAAVSSPFFINNYEALSTTFRHAVHAKRKAIADSTSIFSRSTPSRLTAWVTEIMRGLQGGQAVVRLAAAGGLLLGLEDVKLSHKIDVRDRRRVEDEIILCLAEVMDIYRYEYEPTGSQWESEFKQTDAKVLPLVIHLAAQYLPLIPPDRSKLLPLDTCSSIICSDLLGLFNSGSFLSTPIPPSAMASLPAISRLSASTVSLLLESRPAEGLAAADQLMEAFRGMAQVVETRWPTFNANATPEAVKDAWLQLKTFLFSFVMIAEAILSALVFVPPSVYAATPLPTPSALALVVLRTLSHVCFVVTQFGLGSLSSKDASFKELDRTFYLALDIVSAQNEEAERLARGFSKESTALEGRTAYVLACMEQLVPALDIQTIQDVVWPVCEVHLSDAEKQESYEAAHSVVVAILSEHSDKLFTQQLVPYYVECLLENSRSGALTRDQLCIAFRSTVSCATHPSRTSTDSGALAWHAVSALLTFSRSLSQGPSPDAERRLKLNHMLISTVSVLPLGLLERVLDEISEMLQAEGEYSAKELAQALYTEIVERVGNAERETVLRWWFQQPRPVGQRQLQDENGKQLQSRL